jgi:hypothetical protein
VYPLYRAHDNDSSVLDASRIVAFRKGEKEPGGDPGRYWIRVYLDGRRDAFTLRYDYDERGRVFWQHDYNNLAEGRVTNDAS